MVTLDFLIDSNIQYIYFDALGDLIIITDTGKAKFTGFSVIKATGNYSRAKIFTSYKTFIDKQREMFIVLHKPNATLHFTYIKCVITQDK